MLSNLSNLFTSKELPSGCPMSAGFATKSGYTTKSGREDWLLAHKIPLEDWDSISTNLVADPDPEVYRNRQPVHTCFLVFSLLKYFAALAG